MHVSRKVVARLCPYALAGLALLGLLAPSAVAAPGAVKVGSPPHVPLRSRAIGALSGTTTLAATVTLQPRDPAGLQAFASQVATPGSSVYHDYLSVAQFAQRFGPTTAQINAVEASMRAHGLHPGSVSPNGLSIRVVASAQRLEHAFSTSFERYVLAGGRTAFANVSAPLLDASVAKTVQGVIGLDTLATPRPIGLLHPQGSRARAQTPHVVTGGPQPCAAATSAQSSAQGSGSHTADQLASAYRFSSLYGSGDLGAGQTIALYELEPYDPNDIAAYQACYGTSTAVSDVPVDGGAGSGAGAGEAALDIEDVIGLAPKANILVYSGPNSNSGSPGSGPYDTYSTIISQDVAKVISTSWGICESQQGSSNAAGEYTLFEEAATQGQTIVAAAGDSGAEDCTDANGNPIAGLAVDDPGSQPFVTGVGGTTLNALGPPPGETVWNESSQNPPAGAGGGGISSFWTMPSYQSSAAASLNVFNASSSGSPCHATSGGYCREVPDVSADADPYTGHLIYYNGAGTVSGAPSGWVGIGGTSAAAPLWAALLALTDASRACNGTPIGFANPVLYRAAGNAYASDVQRHHLGEQQLQHRLRRLLRRRRLRHGLGARHAERLGALREPVRRHGHAEQSEYADVDCRHGRELDAQRCELRRARLGLRSGGTAGGPVDQSLDRRNLGYAYDDRQLDGGRDRDGQLWNGRECDVRLECGSTDGVGSQSWQPDRYGRTAGQAADRGDGEQRPGADVRRERVAVRPVDQRPDRAHLRHADRSRSLVRHRARSRRERRLRHSHVHMDDRRPSDRVESLLQRDREGQAGAVVHARSWNGCPPDRDRLGRPAGRRALRDQRQRPDEQGDHRQGARRQAPQVHRQGQPRRVVDHACVPGRRASGHDRGAGDRREPDARDTGRRLARQNARRGGRQGDRLGRVHDPARVEDRRVVEARALFVWAPIRFDRRDETCRAGPSGLFIGAARTA